MNPDDDFLQHLVRDGRCTESLASLLREQAASTGRPLVEVALESAGIPAQTILEARALAAGLEACEPGEVAGVSSLPEGVPVEIAVEHRFAPLRAEGGVLVAAFAEPPSLALVGRLRVIVGLRVRVRLCLPDDLRTFASRHFGIGADTLRRIRPEHGHAVTRSAGQEVFDVAGGEGGDAATIARFVDLVLAEALRLGATDLHLEPEAGAVKLRYRVDGLLQDVPVPEGLRSHYLALVSRLKVMADLDITERRAAQDGRISMKRAGAQYDLRVSVIPTAHGESVCLRFLGRSSLRIDLSELGMEPEQRRVMESLARLPQGLALLTGPTGSGKTTTLYGLLASARDGRRKIITIEDPVEYQLDGVSQIQVRPESGLDFASGLRSVLRHDPDVILIGEIRDRETADAAMRAAQTGHLVFSTLHTNDSLGALTRLVDMGIEPWSIGSSLVCSVAQRLARRVCPACAEEEATLSPALREEMARSLGIATSEVVARRGRGCSECLGSGERGRVAIYEILLMNDGLVDSLASGLRTVALRDLARASGWSSLRDQAWRKVQAGVIPVSEVQRLTRRLELVSS